MCNWGICPHPPNPVFFVVEIKKITLHLAPGLDNLALGDPILYDTILHQSIVCENVKVVVYFRLILRWPNATHFHW